MEPRHYWRGSELAIGGAVAESGWAGLFSGDTAGFAAKMRRPTHPVSHIQLRRGDSFVSSKTRFQREVKDAASEQRPLHRIGRHASLEHLLDIPYHAGEVSVRLAGLDPHPQRKGGR